MITPGYLFSMPTNYESLNKNVFLKDNNSTNRQYLIADQNILDFIKQLSNTEAKIFDYLMFMCFHFPIIDVSYAHITQKIGCTERYVKKVIKLLCDRELLIKKCTYKKSNQYSANPYLNRPDVRQELSRVYQLCGMHTFTSMQTIDFNSEKSYKSSKFTQYNINILNKLLLPYVSYSYNEDSVRARAHKKELRRKNFAKPIVLDYFFSKKPKREEIIKHMSKHPILNDLGFAIEQRTSFDFYDQEIVKQAVKLMGEGYGIRDRFLWLIETCNNLTEKRKVGIFTKSYVSANPVLTSTQKRIKEQQKQKSVVKKEIDVEKEAKGFDDIAKKQISEGAPDWLINATLRFAEKFRTPGQV